MYSMRNRELQKTLKATLLASVALLAAGCTADWSNGQNANYRFTQNPPLQANAQDPYELGKKQFAEGLYGMALKNFRVAMVREPKSLDRLNAVAATYDKLGRFDLAERYYARALGVDPDSVQTLNNIGYSFLIQKDYVSARYYLDQAAKVAGTEHDYIAVVGANLVSLDMAEGRTTAIAHLQRPIQADNVATSVDGIKTGTQGEVHAIATQQDVAKVVAAGTMPEQAGGSDGAGMIRDKAILVPAALIAPQVNAAPVTKVEAVPLATKSVSAVKPKESIKRPLAALPEMLIEVSNGAGRNKLAARTRGYLGSNGISVGRLTNAEHFNFANSTIFYRKGYGDKAREIADMFPMPVDLKVIKEQRSHIRILLGADSLEFDSMRLAEFKGS